MTRFLFSAQDICATRLCAARDCGFDAELGAALCVGCQRRLARGIHVPLHVVPPNVPDTLRCSVCHKHKLDEDFAHSSNASHRRRYRHAECRQCCKNRKRRAARESQVEG